jgi:hypothetical protein
MQIILLIFIILTILLIVKVMFEIKEKFVPEYLHHKTKCVDCENQARIMYGDDGAWTANPSKTYSAEQQGVDQNGLAGGFIGKTIKYY